MAANVNATPAGLMSKQFSPAMATRIEVWPIEKLVPYDRNARTHSPEQVSQLAASIVEFGFTNPILVDSEHGVIAGHGRLTAAQELKLAEVPVVVLDHLTPKQKKAYVLADNKLALNAGWDQDLLREELIGLNVQDFDLSLLGWDEAELENILGADADELDEMPELSDADKEPVQQITFTLHDDQMEIVKEALVVAAAMGDFVDTGNENKNGNSIARVAELFLSWSSDHGVS